MSSEIKKILITGANGLLGSELLKILHNSYEIHALVRATPEYKVSGVTYYQLDFESSWKTEQLPSGIDSIIHLSQSNEFRNFPDKALSVFDVNVTTTARLLDFAYKTKVKKFILASSGGVYGEGGGSLKENTMINANSNIGYYLGSKLCTEILAQNYTIFFDVHVMRFFFMYGKQQKRSMLIPRLVDSVKHGKPVQIQGEVGIKINPIHVSDAALAVKNAIPLNGSYTFNIAGPEILSIYEIVNIVSSKVGLKPNIEKRETHPINLIADIDLMKSLLHHPKMCFSEGVDELINE